ncbi:MAG: hypothetical protein COU51_05070 [Parcubacteria group bacterium CG10_big_fil_rev_8_21_14_0_10_36_14]|nr:MAG: hypothetical protein COU51_05070 [Parcubacteria group bacterium CG10_big_fil_rev_8_21_14_0_10_36_14]
MSIINKLFKRKEKKEAVVSTEPDNFEIMECPSCHSQKVSAQFYTDSKSEKGTGGTMKLKNVCGACGHTWGETDIDESELCILPKPFNNK